ncbi:hypothetical protein Tco_1549046 [Tanacetum coccineum]
MFKQLHINISLADALILNLKYQKMLKAFLYKKEKLLELVNTPLNENCSAIILKKLPEKLGDPGKFPIPCSFSELNCKASLANLGAMINLIATSVLKNANLEFLLSWEDLLRTTRGFNDMHGEELILIDVKDDIFDPKGDIVLIEKLLNLDSTKDLPPSPNVNPLSGSTTSSSPRLRNSKTSVILLRSIGR